jgi:hypothetical protein
VTNDQSNVHYRITIHMVSGSEHLLDRHFDSRGVAFVRQQVQDKSIEVLTYKSYSNDVMIVRKHIESVEISRHEHLEQSEEEEKQITIVYGDTGLL